MEKWERAAEIFLAEWENRNNVIGALVCGSYVTGFASENSDIDMHLILSPEITWRERGNRIIDGFLIEYFANPPDQIRAYFRGDHADSSHMSDTQFVTGRILFDSDGTVAQLKAEAEEWICKEFDGPSATWIEPAKYGIWSRLDDLQDAYKTEAPHFAHIYHYVLRRIYEVYARFLKQPSTDPSKLYRCIFDPEMAKSRYRIDPFPDPVFLEMLHQALVETEKEPMLRHAENLTAYLLEKMGGFEIDGWKLRSPAGR